MPGVRLYPPVIHLHGTFCVLLKLLIPATVLAAIPTQYSRLGSKLLTTRCEFFELVVSIVFVSRSTLGQVVRSVAVYATEYKVGNPLLSSNVSWVQIT